MPKKIRIELAKVGVWGSEGNATPLTPEDLREVAETFAEIQKAPVTLGHQFADFMPAFGWVTSLNFDEQAGVLYGDVELSDLLADAYEQGLYQKWSIGIRRRASDGKRYLHHLAFLGAVPPKIKDLRILDGQFVFAEEPDELWIELAENVRYKSYAKTSWPIADPKTPWDADGAKRRLVNKGGWKLLAQCCGAVEFHGDEKELPDAISRYKFPFCDVIEGKVQIVPKAVSAGLAYLHGARGVKVNESLARVVRPVLEKLRSRIEKSQKKEAADMATIEVPKEQWEKLQKEREAYEAKLREYEARMKEAKAQEIVQLAEGKVPKEKLGLVRLLAQVVPLDQELEFADESGGKRKITAIELLKEIFAAIPEPVRAGRFEFSDNQVGGRSENVSPADLMDRI